jgi:hypothetical protein
VTEAKRKDAVIREALVSKKGAGGAEVPASRKSNQNASECRVAKHLPHGLALVTSKQHSRAVADGQIAWAEQRPAVLSKVKRGRNKDIAMGCKCAADCGTQQQKRERPHGEGVFVRGSEPVT